MKLYKRPLQRGHRGSRNESAVRALLIRLAEVGLGLLLGGVPKFG